MKKLSLVGNKKSSEFNLRASLGIWHLAPRLLDARHERGVASMMMESKIWW